jgi:hypothetical protein
VLHSVHKCYTGVTRDAPALDGDLDGMDNRARARSRRQPPLNVRARPHHGALARPGPSAMSSTERLSRFTEPLNARAARHRSCCSFHIRRLGKRR